MARVIDGTHIFIMCLRESAANYYNRKGYYSIIMQAVVDHTRLFLNAYIGWPGKVHERIERICELIPLSQRNEWDTSPRSETTDF